MNTLTYDAIAAVVGPERVSNEQQLLKQFMSTHVSEGRRPPSLIVWPSSAEEVARIVSLANNTYFPMIPVSSGLPRLNGSTGPKVAGTVILNLRKMNRIIRIDSRNKVAMIEPGVTYDQLLPELSKAGLRPLMPLLPKKSQSVLTNLLDREPTTIPRFHWDVSDPLLCTETVFGTGEMLRTGSASGPGSLEEQWKSGQAQKNPMGPSQFDPFRLVQGSQGTIGVVTWVTMKCEMAPEVHRVYLVGSDSLESLQEFNYAIIRRRLVDEHFILNVSCLSEMLGREVRDSVPEWVLVLGLSGHGPLAQEEFDYRLADTEDIAKSTGVRLESRTGCVNADEVQSLLNVPSPEPYWKIRTFGGCREVHFTATLDMVPELYLLFMREAEKQGVDRNRIGVYVQPVVQGVNVHCCFDIYHNPQDEEDASRVMNLFVKGSQRLMESGAFFSRPPDALRKSVYSHVSPETLTAMKQVKAIFDPKNVLTPGNLCFEEVSE